MCVCSCVPYVGNKTACLCFSETRAFTCAELVCTQTDKYREHAERKAEEKLKRQAEKRGQTWESKGRKRPWGGMSRAKLLAFIGTLILLGYVKYNGSMVCAARAERSCCLLVAS